MPSDIRKFFGGKSSQGVEASQEKHAPSKNTTAAKPKGRGKRKVVSDSEDEVQDLVPKKATPKKAASKNKLKRESPVGEITTTSDYFASSKKSKPTHSTPTKSKVVVPSPKPSPVKSTPKSKSTPKQDSNRNARMSSRKRARTSYVELTSDVDDTPTIKVDEESGEDIYGADYKLDGKKMEDDYQSDDEEEDEIKPTRKGSRRGAQAASKTVKKQDSDSDINMRDEGSHNGFVVYDEEENVKVSKPVNGSKIGKPRKRKSVELEEDDEDEEDGDRRISKRANGTKRAPTKKPTPKKPRAKKDDVPESKETQAILDSIPLVRAPTPPPRDADNKFDFRNNAQRSQPAPCAGSKEIPTGADNCLAGLNFVFTGLLDALSRDDGTELVKRYGGKVTTAPSSKTNFVVLGNEAGPKKLETIAKLNIKTINEDGLFALIRTLPANGGDSKAAEKFEEKQRLQEKKIRDAAEEIEKQERMSNATTGGKVAAAGKRTEQGEGSNSSPVDSRLWTVKYAPTAASQICGNKAQVEKLQTWLRAWRDNARTKFKKGGKDGSGVFRAVIIHGAPGIGKTTAAHLAAKLEGYDIVESNASDTRSKKLVDTGLKGVLDTTSLRGYFAGDGKKVDVEKKKLVLIMDEVDGMSAGDRGGVGALAAVCKKTNVPMILICNDRKLPKMKPFDHVTFDLPFRKPTTEQVRTRIMTILFREGMKDMIPGKVVDALIEGSRADIRQIINMISTAKVDQQAMDFDSGKKMTNAWEKHVILKPWDIVNKILAGGMFAQSSKSTLNEKIELYFNDHEMSSLMLQENYLGTSPILSGSYSGKEKNLKNLELVEKASESISDGDLVDRMIHGSQQQWSLMPTHAVFSFVRPASYMSGSIAGHGSTRFPAWLGNNSRQSKLLRFVKEIQGHMRLRSSGDRHEIRQQYLPLLWYRLIHELNENGKEVLENVIALMDSYFLTKEDWDAILELGVGPMSMDSVKLDTQTKTAFTRTYNQQSHPMPFMKASNVVAPKKQAKERPDLEEALEDSDELEEVVEVEGEDEDDTLDLKKDKYVRAPKKKTVPKKSSAKKGAGKTKGKAKNELEEEDGLEDEESEEDVKPQKSKGRAKASATKGRGKK